MLYHVKGTLKEGKGAEFYTRLTDGSIAALEPDGREIVRSMKRARVQPSGVVEWSETCYCKTPLNHERQTVLDHYFDDLEIALTETTPELNGDPFMDSLTAKRC